jgi:hypothetical protein
MLSRNTDRVYVQHRSGTHNARTIAENTADVHALPNGSGDEGRNDALDVTASELRSCQRSSVVEHPTHNGKVAGSYPAAGIAETQGGGPDSDPTAKIHCPACGRRRWLRARAKYPVCAPCRGRKKPRAFTKAPHARKRKHGDRYVDHRGYVRVRVGLGKHSMMYEHRVVMAATLGRPLLSSEDVHHINEDKQDNRPENLEVVSRSAHTAHHNSVSPKRRKLSPESMVAFALASQGGAR